MICKIIKTQTKMLRKLVTLVPAKRFVKSSARKFSSSTTAADSDSDVKKPIIILGIETSCDDTGIGIVNSNGDILGQAMHSQEETHSRLLINFWKQNQNFKKSFTKICFCIFNNVIFFNFEKLKENLLFTDTEESCPTWPRIYTKKTSQKSVRTL